MPGHQPGPPRAVLGQDQLPGPPQARGQDQESQDGADGERVWEAAVGRGEFREGTSVGHQEPWWASEAPAKGDGGGTPWTQRL